MTTVQVDYYYGDREWGGYLKDIRAGVESGNYIQMQGNRLQAEVLGIAREQRGQTLAMRRIEDALSLGFEQMRADFRWGFSLLADRMDRQIQLAERIAVELDKIHKVLQSPTLTQAREFFRIGQQRLAKGLLDKALESFLQAEQKNDADFLLQLQIGKLFLYGRDQDSNVIDLSEAERHLSLAGRYAKAEGDSTHTASGICGLKEYCGQAYFHAAVAAYLVGNQERSADRPDAMRSCLERALGYLEKAQAAWPEFLEIFYTRAKCHALLEQREEMQRDLDFLSDRDRRYFARATEDKDFDGFRQVVEETFRHATESPGPFAQATERRLNAVNEGLGFVRGNGSDSKEIARVKDFAHAALESIHSLDVDLVDMFDQLGRKILILGVIAGAELDARDKTQQAEIGSIQSNKQSAEEKFERLRKANVPDSRFDLVFFALGTAFVGALVMAAAYVIVGVVYLFGSVSKNQYRLLVIGGGIFFAILWFMDTYLKERKSRTKSIHESKVTALEMQRFEDALSLAKQQAVELHQEISRFRAWRQSAAIPSPRMALP